MKMALPNSGKRGNIEAYTLAELLIAMLILAIMGLALHAGFTAGFSAMGLARENLRATQVLVQRMETIRLYTWSQVNSNSYLFPVYTELYDPLGKTNATTGAIYTVRVDRSTPTNLPAAYYTNMRAITVTVYWTNYVGGKKIPRWRQMQTYVARYGVQPYVISIK